MLLMMKMLLLLMIKMLMMIKMMIKINLISLPVALRSRSPDPLHHHHPVKSRWPHWISNWNSQTERASETATNTINYQSGTHIKRQPPSVFCVIPMFDSTTGECFFLGPASSHTHTHTSCEWVNETFQLKVASYKKRNLLRNTKPESHIVSVCVCVCEHH